MIFFKKKEKASPATKPHTVRATGAAAEPRILTAEGWRRRVDKKLKKSK